MSKNNLYFYIGSLLVSVSFLLFISLFTAEAFFSEGDTLYPIILFSLTAIVLCLSVVKTTNVLRKGNKEQLEYNIIGILRFVTSTVMLGYSFTKLHNGHMYISYSSLDSRLNELNDLDTVWSFYGRYSSLQMLLGIFELVPAFLLLFRRTTFLGALLMVPVVANVVLLNVYYQIGGFTLYVSSLVLIFTIYILYSFKSQILEFLEKVSSSPPTAAPMNSFFRRSVRILRFAPLGLFAFIMIVGVIRPHQQTPIKGGFELVELKQKGKIVGRDSLAPDTYRKIYFEKRKIQSSVINNSGQQGAAITFFGYDSLKITYRNGALDTYVEEDTNAMFIGRYEILKNDLIVLRGKQENQSFEAQYKKLPLREFAYWWE